MIGGFYRPGRSTIHRLSAGRKLGLLAAAGFALFFVVDPFIMTAAAFSAAVIYRLAGFPFREPPRQLRPVAPVLVIVFLAQGLLVSWPSAVVVTARFATLLLLASLVTLTTRPAAMIETVQSALAPLERLGFDTRKVGLAIALVLRFVPVLAEVAAEVRQAQAARGGGRSVRHLTVPVIVRTLKMADEIAEAIDARGFERPDRAAKR